MIRRPPRATRTDTLFPYTTLFRSWPNRTVADFARERVAAHPQKIHIFDGERQLSCIALYQYAQRLAGHFVRIGLQPGDVISLQLQNRSEERRVGKECVRKYRSGWSTYLLKKKEHQNPIINE